MTNRCWRCGRKITEPLSVYVGMGPICREACGLVGSFGWRGLEQVRWWREELSAYNVLVINIEHCLRWWKAQFWLLDQNLASRFDEPLDLVEQLRTTDPRERGQVVMGLVWGIVARIRFELEPTLRLVRDDLAVPHPWVEAVPSLDGLMPSLEGILCGLRAAPDAVELAEVRIQDRLRFMEGRELVPVENEEAVG